MSNLSTQLLKTPLELTPMTSSYISFLSKYTTEKIIANNLSVKNGFLNKHNLPNSVSELHLEMCSLTLLSKVKNTSLTPTPRYQRKKRTKIAVEKVCPHNQSHTHSPSIPLGPRHWFCLSGGALPPHPTRSEFSWCLCRFLL